MSFHLLAYEESIDNTANVDLDAITDDIITIQNSHFFPSVDLQLQWASAMAATLDRCRIQTPTLRQITPPFIRPIIAAAIPADNDEPADYIDNPFRLPRLEEIALEATSAVAMGSEQCLAFLGVTAGMQQAPVGNVYTMRGVSTTASVALTWTTLTTTWADTLPDGRYAVVGLYVRGATNAAARIIFEEQQWRPGCLTVAAIGSRSSSMFRKGRLGTWGLFNSWAFPQIQVLNTAAVSDFNMYLDLVRVA